MSSQPSAPRLLRKLIAVHPFAVRSLALALGLGVLAVPVIANAAPQPLSASELWKLADTTTPAAGDVVVPTESGSTSSPTTGSANGSSTPVSTTAADTRFTCELSGGQYTVMYHPDSQPGKAYAWANPSAMGGGWTSERRCGEISRRLESYRPDGLQEMRTGVENGYNVVCVTTQKVPDCRIVLTVPPGQDPMTTRDRVFQNLTVADSGQQTQGVSTLVSRDSNGNLLNQLGQVLNLNLPDLGGTRPDSINLRPFLDRRDGGTGAKLVGGMSTNPGRRLNPNKFR